MAAALLFGNQISAQSFDVGSNAFNFGLGLGTRYSYYYSYGERSVSPALIVAYDRGVTQLGPGVLGIGGLVGFQTVKWEYRDSNYSGSYVINYKRRWSNTLVGARGTYHWNEWHGNDKLDLYAGVFVGYNIGTYTSETTRTINGVTTTYDDGYASSSSYARGGAFAGARYLFTPKFGVYGEVGYGVAYLNAGLTLVL